MNYGGVGQVKHELQTLPRSVSGKFPEYCDIGLDVFFDVYDWHVRHQQQIQISRIADQRMAIQFMFTQLILRWENAENYIGPRPYRSSSCDRIQAPSRARPSSIFAVSCTSGPNEMRTPFVSDSPKPPPGTTSTPVALSAFGTNSSALVPMSTTV